MDKSKLTFKQWFDAIKNRCVFHMITVEECIAHEDWFKVKYDAYFTYNQALIWFSPTN